MKPHYRKCERRTFLYHLQCEDVADILLKAVLRTVDNDIQPIDVCEKLILCKKDE